MLGITGSVAAERSNIVVILGDDVGDGDLGCYGATLVMKLAEQLERIRKTDRSRTARH